MRHKILISLILIYLFFISSLYPTDFRNLSRIVWCFFDYTDKLPKKYITIGYVESLSKFTSKNQAFQNETTHTAYIRLYKPIKINPGDKVYIINERNIIVAEAKVKSIIKTTFTGYSLVVKGNLYTVFPRYEVVVRYKNIKQWEDALFLKVKGDESYIEGDLENALLYYKQALSIDKRYPEPALYIGIYHYNRKEYKLALPYFQIAYQNRNRIVDNNDLLLLYEKLFITYIKLAKKGYYDGDSPASLYPKALAIINNAINDFKNIAKLYYYRAMLYDALSFKEKKIKDLETAYKLDPNIYEVNIALAKELIEIARAYKQYQSKEYKDYIKQAEIYLNKAKEISKDKQEIYKLQALINRIK